MRKLFLLVLLPSLALGAPVMPDVHGSYVASLGLGAPSLEEMVLGQARPRTGSSSGSGVVTAVTAANGLSLTAGTLAMAAAGAAAAGAVTTGVQSFAGAKTFTGAISASNLSNTNSGDITLATVGSTPAAAGASLSTQVLTLQPADGTNGGVISLLAQTMGAGIKTFTSAPSFSAGTTYAGTGTIFSTGSSTVFEMRGSKTAASGAAVLRVHPGSSYAGTAGALIQIWESDNSATIVATVDKDGSYRQASSPTLQTCAAGLEGTTTRQAGGTSGTRTYKCTCTSDGGGSPAYAWVRDHDQSVGTTTTCP